jgi:DNA-binding HxlR family transcriptional regulator
MNPSLHQTHGKPTAPPSPASASGREDDSTARLLRQPIRLGILRALLAHDTMSFTEIKQLMKVTDGNLSVHARKLEDAQIVSCTKGFRGRFPRTEYRLTQNGRLMVEGLLAGKDERGA